MNLNTKLLTLLCLSFSPFLFAEPIDVKDESRIILIGNGLGARMMQHNLFETALHEHFPDKKLFIRNLCDEGNTPAYRPHSARTNPWAFPGAERFFKLEKDRDRWSSGHTGKGFFRTSDQWLYELKPDFILAFFGYNESFAGEEGAQLFKEELENFIQHTKNSYYNGRNPAELVLVSPIAFQNLSSLYGTPDGVNENIRLALYTSIMKELSKKHKVKFINLFSLSKSWLNQSVIPYTRDGALLTDKGYQKLVPQLVDELVGKKVTKSSKYKNIKYAVAEKNWLWQKYYKIPNGVHVYGQRHQPYGPQNYPTELKKIEQMLHIRDENIWANCIGKTYNIHNEDSKTIKLPNYGKKNTKYIPGKDTLNEIKIQKGYKIELFASEKEFPDLANPVQCSFDNKGRLWVATMPSYPHYQPGDPKPNDKLLILEDTNSDGKADKQIIFADGLHLPTGFEISHDGVYVAQGYSLIFLKDTNDDDKADHKETIMSGFDDHDTHHAISAFCADPSGAIIMGEGTFLHSNIETAYGPVRSSNGGFFRYDPSRRKLERSVRLSIPNPWGIAFDRWGQDFFADTSHPNMRWMLPASIRIRYGKFAPLPKNLLSELVRPTSGLEFVSSRHFPEEVQGDILINNVIGFQGTKQHSLIDDGTGFKSSFRHDLLKSKDLNYRPVDMEFAPDGSLYFVDWHNARIGHMQHNARDPNRDHSHGRIYRLTYPSRPLVKPANIADANIPQLLDNLKLPEYRTRYRTRRELRGRNKDEVVESIKTWAANLNSKDKHYEHHLLEALWVSWGINRIDETLLNKLLNAKDFRARSAAVRALRYNTHKIKNQVALLKKAAKDEHGRVRLEATVAASWLKPQNGLKILNVANTKSEKLGGLDDWSKLVNHAVLAALTGKTIESNNEPSYKTHLTGENKKIFLRGAKIYSKEGHCIMCHQADGNGLAATGFPPLRNNRWVSGDKGRLIKLVNHGLIGPIEVNGKTYPGLVPMTPFKMLSDREMADVLSFIRNTFGNKASLISEETVKKVRESSKHHNGYYTSKQLLEEHPFK